MSISASLPSWGLYVWGRGSKTEIIDTLLFAFWRESLTLYRSPSKLHSLQILTPAVASYCRAVCFKCVYHIMLFPYVYDQSYSPWVLLYLMARVSTRKLIALCINQTDIQLKICVVYMYISDRGEYTNNIGSICKCFFYTFGTPYIVLCITL